MIQLPDYGNTSTSMKLSFPPIFLSCSNSIRRGGDSNFNDGRSKPVIVRFRGLMRTGAMLISWVPVVRWEGTRSWDGIRVRRPSWYALRLGI